MTYVCAARTYRSTDDVCLVTTFFNPAGFESKRALHAEFARVVAGSGLRLVTVECAFGDAPFELSASPDTIHVRAKDAMWQKERLINLAVERLPAQYRKVVWIDCDVYFENADWALETARRLDDFPLVQPFDTAYWLPRGAVAFEGDGLVLRGFAACYGDDHELVTRGDFEAHGFPGYAWAARRELFERHGLYDACIIGGGDHLIAHAACGDWTSPCFGWSVGFDSAHHRHFARWAEAFHADLSGRIGFVPGGLLHAWHGNWQDRNYTFRHKGLKSYGFDPATDLRVGPGGSWEWSSDKPEMHAWTADYFANRREDDHPERSVPTAAERRL